MKSTEMALLMLLSMGMAEAAPVPMEQPSGQVRTIEAKEAAPAPRTQANNSPARKAEMVRRLFWLALRLR